MLRRSAVAFAFACLAFASSFVAEISAKAVHRGFIRMQDGLFVDQECREFNFVGANAYVSKSLNSSCVNYHVLRYILVHET